MAGTDPTNPDTDGDGVPDGWEAANGLDPLTNDVDLDPDGDGLTNMQEFILGTNPLSADTDGDGIPDQWEVHHGTDPLVDDAADDLDSDGISNLLQYQLSSSMIVNFKLDAGGGTAAVDSSGNGNHGTLVNDPGWIPGHSGGSALELDGTDDYVSSPAVELGDEFTIMMLVKLPDPVPGDTRTLMANSASGDVTDGFRLFVNSSGTSDRRLVLETGNGTDTAAAETSDDDVPLDEWTHVAVVVNRGSGTAALYVNGVDVTDSSGIRTDFANDLALQLGRMADDASFLEGQLDEIQVYGRQFGAPEIAAVAAAQLAVPVPLAGLSLWLKADQGVTADSNLEVSEWTDHSGQSNHATQSTGSLRPKLVYNAIHGQPALRLDGVDDYLDLPAATASSMSLSDFRDGLTVIIVARPNALQTSARFLTLSRGAASNVMSIAYNKPYSFTEISTNLEYYISNPSTGVSSVASWFALSEGQFKYHQITQTPTTGGNGDVEIRGNGHVLKTGVTPLPNYSTSQPRDKNYVGRSSYSNQPFLDAEIAEILVYQRPLSESERRQVEYYLYKKYRQFTSRHPTSPRPPAVPIPPRSRWKSPPRKYLPRECRPSSATRLMAVSLRGIRPASREPPGLSTSRALLWSRPGCFLTPRLPAPRLLRNIGSMTMIRTAWMMIGSCCTVLIRMILRMRGWMPMGTA